MDPPPPPLTPAPLESPATQRLLANADALALVLGFLDGASLARTGGTCAAFADAALGATAHRFDVWRLSCLTEWRDENAATDAAVVPAWPLAAPPRAGGAARRLFARRAVLARLCRDLVRAAALHPLCRALVARHFAALGPEALAPLARIEAGAVTEFGPAAGALVRARAFELLRSISHSARACDISALAARAQAQAQVLPPDAAASAVGAAAGGGRAAADEEEEEAEAPPRSLRGRGAFSRPRPRPRDGAVCLEDGFTLISTLGSHLAPQDADREREYVAARLGAVGIARRLDELAERVRAVLRAEAAGAAASVSNGAGAVAAAAAAAAAPPLSVRSRLLAVNRVLFVEEGFRLASTYADPRASLLADVLQSKRGLPILLCAVYEAVCRRLGVPGIEPVGLPSFFILKYEPPAHVRAGSGSGGSGGGGGGGSAPVSLRARPANAPVALGPEHREPEVDAATAMRFGDDEE